MSAREVRPTVKRGICIFFLQPRGCKKGLNCDFSHDKNEQYSNVKVPKVCHNGQGCSWKPRCRYVHLEDGETIPPRAPRGEGRTTREVVRRSYTREGFGRQDYRQTPPENTMTNYPNLNQPQNPSMFIPWMEIQRNQ